MLSSLTLDDATGTPVVFHETTKRCLTSASGLVGIGPLRDSRRVLPQAHGALDETRFEDGRIIVLEGDVMSTVSVEDAFAEFRLLTTPMLQTLDVGPAWLKWREGVSGLQLQRLVKLASDAEPILTEGAALLRYQAQFFAEDPRAYSQTLQTATGSTLSTLGGGLTFPMTFPITFTASGGGTVSVTNAGNRPTSPVFRIYGTCTNPQIVIVGGSSPQRIVLNGTVASNEFLELDVHARTIRASSGGILSNRLSYLDAANTSWFDLAPGTTNLQMIAGSFDGNARLDVLFRDAYA